MSLEVLPPQFEADKKRYIFLFRNAPKIEETTTDPSKLAITEEDLTAVFVDDFLKQASKYFSKALDRPVFYRRVTYHWQTDEVDLSDVLQRGDSFRATWIPARIIFCLNRYEIHFTLAEVEPYYAPTTIPSGFLSDLGVPGEVVDTVIIESELPELPIAEIGQGGIPFGQMSAEEKAERERARQRIRQARLKAALAKLHTEKLAERYYKRYGNFDGGASDSDLSSESDQEGETGKI